MRRSTTEFLTSLEIFSLGVLVNERSVVRSVGGSPVRATSNANGSSPSRSEREKRRAVVENDSFAGLGKPFPSQRDPDSLCCYPCLCWWGCSVKVFRTTLL